MKKLTLSSAILFGSFFLASTESNACGGSTWYTCGNLLEFMIQVSQNCCAGNISVTDCDAGSFTLRNEEDGPNSSCAASIN
ncbi:hypothetical protein [Algoriphagus mannitolivorans]|uniref:hypothetical protein n=1 Tax=Algoriphagus mannitolivorans TaxID=226504 RepID=UPI00042659EA|nr:hypothetical protein [Algoriphagus mannitolivorans]